MKTNKTQISKNTTTMKTTNFFSALILILAFATSSYAGGIGTKGNGQSTTSIRYTVNLVYNAPDQPWFSHYAIKIYDQNHQLVASPQVIIPGKYQYVFFERGPADGMRFAIIEKLPIHGQIEPWQTLYCEPAMVKGPFEVGKTYRFDLYPKVTSEKE
jgi:hypothetical protein